MSNTIVYVQSFSTGFQWGLSPVNLVPLSQNIDTQSGSAITYEFVRTGTTAIWYKLPPSVPAGSPLPTSSGPTKVVNPGKSATISFSETNTGTYFTGTVTVSGDGFGLLGGGAGGGAGAGAAGGQGQGHDEHGEGHGYGHEGGEGQGHDDDEG